MHVILQYIHSTRSYSLYLVIISTITHCTCIMYVSLLMLILLYYIVQWNSLILRHGGHVTDGFDMSSIAKVSDGYTPGHINTAVTQVLTERRIQQVRKNQYRVKEEESVYVHKLHLLSSNISLSLSLLLSF